MYINFWYFCTLNNLNHWKISQMLQNKANQSNYLFHQWYHKGFILFLKLIEGCWGHLSLPLSLWGNKTYTSKTQPSSLFWGSGSNLFGQYHPNPHHQWDLLHHEHYEIINSPKRHFDPMSFTCGLDFCLGGMLAKWFLWKIGWKNGESCKRCVEDSKTKEDEVCSLRYKPW